MSREASELWGVNLEGASERFRRTVWAHYAAMVLGLWLVVSPPSLGYDNLPLAVSDVASGVLAILFAWLSLDARRAWPRWANVLVGLWLMMAPLVFHASSAAAYTNDTLAGVLLVSLAVIVPGMPGKADRRELEEEGLDRPEGWSYNPSSWKQRLVPVIFAVLGFFAARYLVAYQLGHIDSVWDPFFGQGSERILDSRISQAFPVPDAGLGAVGYLLDALAALIGGTRRWRTAPWIVILFGIFVIPFGVVSITLVILQPVAVGAWCTLCLFTAVMSLLMIPYAADEVVASGQFLVRARQAGLPFWRTLWIGGAIPSHAPRATGQGGGVTYPWSLLASVALGLYLMVSPTVWGTTGRAADAMRLVGPLVITFSVIALAEPVRMARFLNILFGLIAAAAPWVLEGAPQVAQWSGLLVGLALMLLSLPRGPVKARYGRWERYIA